MGAVAECIHAQARLNRALQMPDSENIIDAAEYFGELCAALVEARLASTGIKLTLAAGALHLEKRHLLDRRHDRHGTRHQRFTTCIRTIRWKHTRRTDGWHINRMPRERRRSQTPCGPSQGLKLIEGLTECLKGSFVQRFEPGGSTSALFFKPDATPRKPA